MENEREEESVCVVLLVTCVECYARGEDVAADVTRCTSHVAVAETLYGRGSGLVRALAEEPSRSWQEEKETHSKLVNGEI